MPIKTLTAQTSVENCAAALILLHESVWSQTIELPAAADAAQMLQQWTLHAAIRLFTILYQNVLCCLDE